MSATWPLRNGPTLPETAVLFALSLERDGHTLSVRAGKDGKPELIVSNGSTLTPEQWDGIKAHRKDILALLAYQAPEAK